MSTPTAIPQGQLVDLAVAFLDTMLDSADVDTIGRTAWWDRARTALETGTATGTVFSEVVSAAARKLQIDGAFSQRTSIAINRLTQQLSDPRVFGDWRELCQRDAVYITALTRVLRGTRSKEKK